MTGVGKRSKEISTLEAQKNKILQSSPVVVKQAELESIFDDVAKSAVISLLLSLVQIISIPQSISKVLHLSNVRTAN